MASCTTISETDGRIVVEVVEHSLHPLRATTEHHALNQVFLDVRRLQCPNTGCGDCCLAFILLLFRHVQEAVSSVCCRGSYHHQVYQLRLMVQAYLLAVTFRVLPPQTLLELGHIELGHDYALPHCNRTASLFSL